jgi:hypothetical protein
MDALEKTELLKRLNKFPLSLLRKNEKNPNKMGGKEFDALCDNFQRTGWTDPVLARCVDLDKTLKLLETSKGNDETFIKSLGANNLEFEIYSGHHRFDAGTFLGFEYGPVVLLLDPDFDEEQAEFQLVRMNAIHGKLDPKAFFELAQKYLTKYGDEGFVQDAFGITDDAEFQRLIKQTAKSIPKEMKDKFLEAAKEIKTVDGLSKLLNELFTKYGDTLPYGFMVFDYNNQKSVWLRISDPKTMKALDVLGDICIDKNRTVDDILGKIVQLIAKGDAPELIDALVAETPEVVIPAGMPLMPTKNNLENVQAVNAG